MPLTLIARILAATAALSGTTRGEAAASTGLGRSSSGGAGFAVAELVLEGARALGVLEGARASCWPERWTRYRQVAPQRRTGCLATAAAAPAITVITRPIAAMTATTTIATCLGPKGSVHLLHARLKLADRH